MKKTILYLAAPLLFCLWLAGIVAGSPEKHNGRPLSTTLTGAAEVPQQGDPDGRGTATITLNPGKAEVCFELNVENVGPVTLSHIHDAEEGASGPPVITLTPPPTDGSSDGCVAADREEILEIIRDPSHYYVNVHNQEYPNGALRGQLSK